MLIGGDFNLNSGQHYTDSVKEVVKQTMLHHDAIFRNQVYELHRIYRIQRTLMKDLSWKEFEKYTSWTANTKSSPSPFQDPQKNKTLTGERIFCEPSMLKPVGSTSTANWILLEDCQDSSFKLRRKTLDLQLPADEYITSAGAAVPENGNLGPVVSESSGMKEFFRANCVPDPEEVKLSLSTGGCTTEKGCSSRSWHNKEACLSTIYVIDSEDSIERTSNEDVKSGSSLTSEAPTTFVGDRHGVQAPFLYDPLFPGRLKEDIGHSPFMNNYSLANQNGSNQGKKPCCSDTELNECQSTVQFIGRLTSNRQTSLCETTHIDLDRVKLDESSSLSSDCFLSLPFLTESSPAVVPRLANESNKETVTTSGRKINDRFSDEASIVIQQDNSIYSALMDSKGEVSGAHAYDVSTMCRENGGNNKVGIIDLERMPGDVVDLCEDFSNQDIKVSKEDIDFSLGLQDGFLYKGYQEGTSDITPISKVESNKLCMSIRCTGSPQAVDDAEVRQINFERSEEDTVSSGPFRSRAEVQAEHCKSSDATSKTSCWTGNNSCRMKDLRSGTVGEGELENSKSSASVESGATQGGYRITETQYSGGKGELDNSKSSAFEESVVNLLGSEFTETHSAEQDPLVETGVYTCACMEERFPDGTKTKQCHRQQHNVEKEMDILVQKAAESLIHISLDNSFCPQDCVGEASNALEEKEMSEQPQYSSDSFELITLRLTECSADDYSVSSMPVEVKETDKGCAWKLKRGSRLKDFQKDILPGLVSLSRHEICEDINIIGAVLRSREYRKSRSRNTDGEIWSLPVKGRRSKLNYIGRRKYH